MFGVVAGTPCARRMIRRSEEIAPFAIKKLKAAKAALERHIRSEESRSGSIDSFTSSSQSGFDVTKRACGFDEGGSTDNQRGY
jgi:hypothetical protein